MPRKTHHPDRTRSYGTHRARPSVRRCPECMGPSDHRGLPCDACRRTPEALGTMAEAWSTYLDRMADAA